jgi:hypothetical protein
MLLYEKGISQRGITNWELRRTCRRTSCGVLACPTGGGCAAIPGGRHPCYCPVCGHRGGSCMHAAQGSGGAGNAHSASLLGRAWQRSAAPELVACSAEDALLAPSMPPVLICGVCPLPPVELDVAPPATADELTAPFADVAAPSTTRLLSSFCCKSMSFISIEAFSCESWTPCSVMKQYTKGMH